jgi:EAL domain-containing protein (putative c-di-GMP-specific phosphodiesterase class I)
VERRLKPEDMARKDASRRTGRSAVTQRTAAVLRRVRAFLRRDPALDEIIRDRRVRVVFQPITDVRSGRVVGVEALARIPPESHLSPLAWFDRARSAGRVIDLDLVAAEAAVAASAMLPDEVFLSVNLTPAGLRDRRVEQVVARHQGTLVVEITEHEAVEDYDLLAPALARLRELGVRIAVDDAGAGFATMRHVLEIRPEILKLDASLTAEVTTDRGAQALTRALAAFADEIGATVVAEGVETADQLARLADLGVTHAQGFVYGLPAALGEVTGVSFRHT